ncbi:MAG: hypothetical protein K2K18_03255 [Malacoplasma sp.]|nr:hypothetical protein [Malacoplasma sp.]
MDYKELKKTYETQFDNLSKLLENKNFIELIENDELLKTNFIDQISVLKFLEKKLSDPKLIEQEIAESKKSKKKLDLIDIKDLNKSSDCSLQYVTAVGPIGTLNEFKEIKKTEEIKDVIKYFDVFLKNTYKKDLKSFLNNDFKEVVKAEKINNNDQFKNSTNTTGNFANFMGGFPNSNNMSYDAWKDQQATIIANQELRKLVDTGEFYLFKSKPKFFVINKIILSSILVLISLMWFIVFLLQIIVTSEQMNVNPPEAGGILCYENSNNIIRVPIVLGNYIFSYIITILSIIYFGIWSYKLLKKPKSENEKFAFDKKSACIVIFLILVLGSTFIFLLVNWIPNLDKIREFTEGTIKISDNKEIIVKNSNIAKSAFDACTWISLTSICLFLFLIIWIIICWIYAPKLDAERIQMKLEELKKSVRDIQN